MMKRNTPEDKCSFYDVISWFIVMLQCVTLTTADTCSRTMIILTVDRNDCYPRNIIVGACRGTCNTYSRPSLEYPGQMERFCQCCDVDDVRQRNTHVTCPVQNPVHGQRPFRRIGVEMNIPRTCRCRPCSGQIGNVIPAEQSIWSQGKRKFDKLTKRKRTNVNDIETLKNVQEPFIFVEDKFFNFTYKELSSVMSDCSQS